MSGRTNNSVRNIITGFGSKIILFCFAFAVRTLFIRRLGAEYNGINGLFLNILSFLSLAELGVTNVLNYTLYKELSENNISNIKLLLKKYKKIYNAIAFAILLLGMLLLPFLKFIVNSSFSDKQIMTYYMLYLANTVISYFVAYKTTLITADQKQYILNICVTVFNTLTYLLQIIALLISKSFIAYLVIQIACTLLQNITVSIIANKKYPYIRNETIAVSNEDISVNIADNVKATFIYKVSSVLINNTDNILISWLLGTVVVGYYSNYYLIIQYLNAYIYALGTGIIASVGNYIVEKSKTEILELFKAISLIYAVIANLCLCCYFTCFQDFVVIWIGKEYVLDMPTLYSILILFYLTCVMNPIWIFRETNGLFKEVRYVMPAAAVINIVLSVILGKLIGLAGIIFASSISRLLTQYWYEPLVLYKKIFNANVLIYFLTQLKFMATTIICAASSYFICTKLTSGSLPGLFIRVIISAAIVAAAEILFNFRTKEFQILKNLAVNMIKKKPK